MLVFLMFSFFFANNPSAVAAVPSLLHHQGRLLDNQGDLLGGTSGTNYCFKFSLYDTATPPSGTKLWPTGTVNEMTVNVKDGVLNVDIGDISIAGEGNLLDFNFDSTDEIYLNIGVAESVGGSCATVPDGDFETLSPRQRIVSAGYAINSRTVGGFTPSQTPTGSQIPVLNSGALNLAGDISSGGLTITKADPALVFNTTTATDTDFWVGVTEDAGGDDDDVFQIGDGTTPGTNPFLTIDTSGNVGIGTAVPGTTLDVAGPIKFQGYTQAGLPTAGTTGRLARVTNTTRGLWMDQGAQWFPLNAKVVNVQEF